MQSDDPRAWGVWIQSADKYAEDYSDELFDQRSLKNYAMRVSATFVHRPVGHNVYDDDKKEERRRKKVHKPFVY